MNIGTLLKVAEKYAVDNSPRLLTAFGAAGTITTAYLTGKAAFKAARKIRAEEDRRLERADLSEVPIDQKLPLTKKEKFDLVWVEFVPPVISGVMSVACIVAANSIHSSRYAALAAAYKLSDKSFTEYKDKVKEMVGDNKEAEINGEIAQDRVSQNPPLENEIISTARGGDTLCLDKWTGRYFRSDMQTIRAIENDIRKAMYMGDHTATLGDFYYSLGIPGPKCAEEVGWNTDVPIELRFDTVLGPNDIPVLVMDFATTPFPIHGYYGHP